MPSAGLDPDSRARFAADLGGLLASVGLRKDAAVGIALSGGPDSVALLLLVASCAVGKVMAMTVDHGLRRAAALEAEAAAALCRTLDVPHSIARVQVGAGSVQAAAREARYAALVEWAKQETLDAILTAHHADDQAETLLMRLARGAGLSGLSGIRAARRIDELWVIRPLLGWRKADLEAICASAGIEPARDPSNHDTRHDRTVARALLATAGWIDAGRVAASASYLAEAEAALTTIADERYHVSKDGADHVLSPDPLDEIARRHLRRLLAERFGAQPSGPSLDLALRFLRIGQTTTCADILCRPADGLWRFRAAPPRRRSKRSL